MEDMHPNTSNMIKKNIKSDITYIFYFKNCL